MQKKWVVTGWTAAAAVAVAAGIGAVALAQGGTLDPSTDPLSQEEALSQLESSQAETPADTASPSPEASESSPAPTGELESVPSDGAGGDEHALAVEGGTVTARCAADGRVELVWWVAAQGWRISSVDPGPDEDVEIEFEGADDEIEYTVVCVDGVPQQSADDDDDD
ncbi:MAG TPA: hypothetical protein VKZ65_01405 [Glycomyces sp.]|nr:hypothetical protein [Glycomyces sp.]